MKTGDIVKVKVLEVDVPRKRIALTMRLDESAVKNDGKLTALYYPQDPVKYANEERSSRGNNAMGNAFADALKIGKNNKL